MDAPQHHDRFPYSAIVDRPPLRWPNGARVAVWVVPNIEHFLFDRPSSSINPHTAGLVPDVLNYSWRDYGVRVGIWRLMEVMEKHGFKGTVALNSDVVRHYPRIIEAGQALGWEWMGHGMTNSTLIHAQPEEEEREIVRGVVDTIERATGRRPRGWLSPALTESHRTLDLLAEAGIDYVANWVNDEQPYPMRVKSGSMLSLPYSIEINDFNAFLFQGQTGEQFAQTIRDQFDVLYEDGAATGRVMGIALHPFLIGHPHRARHFAAALAHIAAHDGVWLATGSEIADWYRKARAEA
ncbi:polysaccharide deacetylase family protein [Inquilinus sp. Marseille-Q2685]|uniref:polysaccharide deacetylase family protein n=1 Tax=Inquilinus sp. Marseille-Q2685 TaxID=2866581 RepID=UPI001CE4B57C|nr:polysaccharide deacetylase family protein [Inquilinus sp. Marseille-Q2685]